MSDLTFINVKVVPGSSKNCLGGWLGETLKVRVTAKREKGKANGALIALLADSLSEIERRISGSCC